MLQPPDPPSCVVGGEGTVTKNPVLLWISLKNQLSNVLLWISLENQQLSNVGAIPEWSLGGAGFACDNGRCWEEGVEHVESSLFLFEGHGTDQRRPSACCQTGTPSGEGGPRRGVRSSPQGGWGWRQWGQKHRRNSLLGKQQKRKVQEMEGEKVCVTSCAAVVACISLVGEWVARAPPTRIASSFAPQSPDSAPSCCARCIPVGGNLRWKHYVLTMHAVCT